MAGVCLVGWGAARPSGQCAGMFVACLVRYGVLPKHPSGGAQACSMHVWSGTALVVSRPVGSH
eukprot:12862498-Alexandrium_andersonii.AAC.1